MASDIPLSDPDDPRLADYRNLPDAQLRRDRRAFIAEGRLVVRRLLTQSACRTRSVLVTPTARAGLDDVLASADVPVYVGSPESLRAITGFNIHRGCLAIGERPAPVAPRAFMADRGPIVVLEGVGNADNVGGVLRNAAAFATSGVVFGPGCCDPLYRKAIRTSMGAALTVPWAHDEAWPAALQDLRDAGWTVLAMTPDRRAADLDVVRAERHERVAIVLGAEGIGLSEAALAAADRRVRIPMRGAADSLNVVVAAGIALYALARHER